MHLLVTRKIVGKNKSELTPIDYTYLCNYWCQIDVPTPENCLDLFLQNFKKTPLTVAKSGKKISWDLFYDNVDHGPFLLCGSSFGPSGRHTIENFKELNVAILDIDSSPRCSFPLVMILFFNRLQQLKPVIRARIYANIFRSVHVLNSDTRTFIKFFHKELLSNPMVSAMCATSDRDYLFQGMHPIVMVDILRRASHLTPSFYVETYSSSPTNRRYRLVYCLDFTIVGSDEARKFLAWLCRNPLFRFSIDSQSENVTQAYISHFTEKTSRDIYNNALVNELITKKKVAKAQYNKHNDPNIVSNNEWIETLFQHLDIRRLVPKKEYLEPSPEWLTKTGIKRVIQSSQVDSKGTVSKPLNCSVDFRPSDAYCTNLIDRTHAHLKVNENKKLRILDCSLRTFTVKMESLKGIDRHIRSFYEGHIGKPENEFIDNGYLFRLASNLLFIEHGIEFYVTTMAKTNNMGTTNYQEKHFELISNAARIIKVPAIMDNLVLKNEHGLSLEGVPGKQNLFSYFLLKYNYNRTYRK